MSKNDNKTPLGYVDATYAGRSGDGIQINIQGDLKASKEYSLAMCDAEGNWDKLERTKDAPISLKSVYTAGHSGKEYMLCIVYNEDGEEKLLFLRNAALDVPVECAGDIYDRRMLYGQPIDLGNEQYIVPYYKVNGVLTIEICDRETYLYMHQFNNEILLEQEIEDEEGRKLYCISTKCKKVNGNYIGIVPISKLGEKDIYSHCIEYSEYEEAEEYAYMDFIIAKEYKEEYKEFSAVWSFRDKLYVAPLYKEEKTQPALITSIDYVAEEGMLFDITYNSDMYGEFVKAECISDVEDWEEKMDFKLKPKKVTSKTGNNVVSFKVNSLKKLGKLGSWYIKLYTKKDEEEYVLDVNIADRLAGKEIYDENNTRYKVAFRRKDDIATINRLFGHNALFKKNIQAEGNISIDEFLNSGEALLKGNMHGEYVERDGKLLIHLYQQMSDVIEAKLVMYHSQGLGILCTQDIPVTDGIVEEVEVNAPDIDWDNKFDKPVSSIWFRVAIAIRTKEGIYMSMMTNYDADMDIEQHGSIHDSRKLYFSPIGNNTVCDINMTAVPYYAANKAVSMKYVRPKELYRSQFTNELLDVKIKNDILTVKMRCRKCHGIYKGVVMEYRNVKEDEAETYYIPYESLKEKKGFYIMTTKIDLKRCYMRMLYWDIRCAFEVDEEMYTVSCHSNDYRFLKKYKNVFVDRTYPNENSIMFPFATGSNSVALMHREICPQDNWRFRLKEKCAEVLYKLFKKHWDKKNIYLIFEKYCTMAQDNGYFFFKYCMDANVEKDFDGEIYYVIDEAAADWEKVVPYKKNVLKYLSMKHMIYLQACKLMISTDTKGHAYVWRSMGSNIKALTYQKKLVFLQHGVTAFKRGHFERGTNVGCESFITTSQFEHDIIHEYLAYPEHEIPITGFARWDVLHDKSEGHREILMMPTWRTWLDDAENEVFAESNYCKSYMSLLNDPRLDDILKRYDVTLNFYIHPKFRKFITEFSVVSENIRLIPFGEEPLNELMMECNMLITDFSSVAWDVYYMNKPVLFYHFDIEEEAKTLGFYMDMKKDIYGDRAEKAEELMELIIEYIENGFQMKEKFSKDREKYFAYVDNNNSERIWKAIQERQW